mmetsp:Transcript_14698/g.62035  ORF Transcript_14698/g.62035 Transcript_14698/m.62035 type:complete len:252 (+) Transcript_14698:3148-3903(+)
MRGPLPPTPVFRSRKMVSAAFACAAAIKRACSRPFRDRSFASALLPDRYACVACWKHTLRALRWPLASSLVVAYRCDTASPVSTQGWLDAARLPEKFPLPYPTVTLPRGSRGGAAGATVRRRSANLFPFSSAAPTRAPGAAPPLAPSRTFDIPPESVKLRGSSGCDAALPAFGDDAFGAGGLAASPPSVGNSSSSSSAGGSGGSTSTSSSARISTVSAMSPLFASSSSVRDSSEYPRYDSMRNCRNSCSSM